MSHINAKVLANTAKLLRKCGAHIVSHRVKKALAEKPPEEARIRALLIDEIEQVRRRACGVARRLHEITGVQLGGVNYNVDAQNDDDL